MQGSDWLRIWKLHPAAVALLETAGPYTNLESALALVKSFVLRLKGPRPIAEAISSAGGIAWDEVDERLMLRKAPGVFVAGEMIDWEAPTGGYLLQGCFATGTRAGKSAANYASLGD
jgi:predicted flavoprotein YhiN